MSHADEIAQLQQQLQQLREKNRDTADQLNDRADVVRADLCRLRQKDQELARELGRALAEKDGQLAEAHARIDGLGEDIRDLSQLEDRLGVLEAWQTSLCEMEELLDVQRDERFDELRDRLDLLEEWQRAAIDMFGRRGTRLRKAEGRISHLEQRLDLARTPDIIPPEPTPEQTLDGTWAPDVNWETELVFKISVPSFWEILDAAAQRLASYPEDPAKAAILRRLTDIQEVLLSMPYSRNLKVTHEPRPDRTRHDEA